MLRLLIILLLVAILAPFALSNLDPMTIWLASLHWQIPSGVFIFATPMIGLVVGLILGWMGELRQRRRARRAESQTRTLEKQLVELHTRLDQLQESASAAHPETPSTPRN